MIIDHVPDRKGGIYSIINIHNNKQYIGSTVNFKKRIKAHILHLKNKSHHSPYLNNAVHKHGMRSFCFKILEVVNNFDILLAREQYYLDIFKTYLPENGYNVCSIAGSHIDVCKFGTVILKRLVDGMIFQAPSVRIFAVNHNLTESDVRGALRGNICKGFCVPDKNIVYRQLIDPQGVIHNIYNLKDYCIFYDLMDMYKPLARVLRGGINEYNGWHLPGNEIKKPLKILIGPDGQLYSFYNTDKFAKENYLVNATVRNILIGKIKEFKGWRLP